MAISLSFGKHSSPWRCFNISIISRHCKMIKLATVEWGCPFYPNWIKLNFLATSNLPLIVCRLGNEWPIYFRCFWHWNSIQGWKERNNTRYSALDSRHSMSTFRSKVNVFNCKMKTWSGNQSILVVVVSIWNSFTLSPNHHLPNAWMYDLFIPGPTRIENKKNCPRRIDDYELFDGLKLSNDHKEIWRRRQAQILYIFFGWNDKSAEHVRCACGAKLKW